MLTYAFVNARTEEETLYRYDLARMLLMYADAR
jgi:hypothetical protein